MNNIDHKQTKNRSHGHTCFIFILVKGDDFEQRGGDSRVQ